MNPQTDRSLRIAGVVVLYYPGTDLRENLDSYIKQVDKLFIIDNSDHASFEVVRMIASLPNADYLPNNSNLGIAAALNIGANRALEQGFDLLLTMDQDSKASPDMIRLMLESLTGRDMTKIGMIAPFHLTRSGHYPGKDICREVMTPMTSGCLLNLKVFETIGSFREELFIDFVDNEYCLRLRKLGYRVLQANKALLEHNVGDIKKYGPFIATNHSPLRRYYKTRNRFYVFSHYFHAFPGHCLFDLVRLAKEITSIILFEEKKCAKLRMMKQGWQDFHRSKYGKYKGNR